MQPIKTTGDEILLKPKSSIASLKIGLKFLEFQSGSEILPPKIPLPLMDPDYFDYGDWAFYADEYLQTQLRPYLNGHGETLQLKPLDLACSTKPVIVKKLDENAALVRVEYPEHKELERILQKLYFNLFRGPVILSVAYDSQNTIDGFSKYENWHCFDSYTETGPTEEYDVHLVYVDWSKIHTIVAFLDDGRIKIVDGGKVYHVDHNALVAQANAIYAYPSTVKYINHKNHLNYLIQLDERF
jgi:hypothetical protein